MVSRFDNIYTIKNYEDKTLEKSFIKILEGIIVYENKDNPFKNITKYKDEDNDNFWVSGYYGLYYVVEIIKAFMKWEKWKK